MVSLHGSVGKTRTVYIGPIETKKNECGFHDRHSPALYYNQSVITTTTSLVRAQRSSSNVGASVPVSMVISHSAEDQGYRRFSLGDILVPVKTCTRCVCVGDCGVGSGLTWVMLRCRLCRRL